LKQDRKSTFFKERQYKARVSKIGKKRPIHSKIMKDKAKRGEIWSQANGAYTKKMREEASKRAKLLIQIN
jgi:hypothetical protein